MASFNNETIVAVDLSSGISDYGQAGFEAAGTRVGWRKVGLRPKKAGTWRFFAPNSGLDATVTDSTRS
jgi:hypothetical protein